MVVLLLVFCLISGFGSGALASNKDGDDEDFSRLLDFIAQDDLQGPLVLFQDHKGDFDRTLNKENIAYLNQNKQLLENIKTRLKGTTLHWKLAASSKRRLIVPEQRPEYADLFQRYCRESVDYLLTRLQSASPYNEIVTLQDPLPSLKAGDVEGIKVYLVHNVADEYVEEYVFFNQDNDTTKIKIRLSNRVFSGIIGSYTSDLVIGENQSFDFIREPYTLWQNSAENPLNVFIAPVEETLHILLRDATEQAIRADLDQARPRKINEVNAVVKDWMAVEEAIVGGIVARVMPEILSRFLRDTRGETLSDALAQRDQHVQYRYLDQGIQIVGDLGLEEAVKLYKSDPMGFKYLVTHSDLAAANLPETENADLAAHTGQELNHAVR